MKMVNCIQLENFGGNVLIVGRTGCEKTYFIQKLVLNNFFGHLVKAEWVLYIQQDTHFCFNCDNEFHYPRDKERLDNLLEV